MLKIIRKYQLVILAVGGSLLMVVFLFQPILGKIAPDPRKQTVAVLADGTKFNGLAFSRASFDIAVLKRVYPRILAPVDQGGLGLDSSDDDNLELHWMLLVKEASDAELIGEAGDGRTWIPLLAQQNALSVVQLEAQQGLFTSGEEVATRRADLTAQFESQLSRNVALASGMMRGMTSNDVYQTLATARGIQRLYGMYASTPAFSDLGAMHAAKERFDAVAIDAVLISGRPFGDALDEPTDDQLLEFFERYKADAPSDNEYQIGYTQPDRIKLGWLTLDKQRIENAVVIDRVELNKIWRLDRKLPEDQRKYPGDFAGERLKIEAEYRADQTQKILVEADRIIRSQILQATRGLSKEGDLYILPDDWETRHPSLESIAQTIVDELNEQLGITIPLPSVDIVSDRWLDSPAVASLDGIGSARFRIGARQMPVMGLPLAIHSEEVSALMPIQAGVLMANPSAEDDSGNRYYPIIYDINPAGPASSIDDVGRDRVLSDYRTLNAYQMLVDNLDMLREQAESINDLSPAISAAMALGPPEITRPGIARNLIVHKDNIQRGRLARFVEPGLNTPAFRDAVMEATKDLDELTTPAQMANSPIIVAVALPGSQGIALAKVVAPRPVTIDQYASQISRFLSSEGGAQLGKAVEASGVSPFSLSSVSDRLGYKRIKAKRGQEEPVEESSDKSGS